jgi:CBS domain containing-hemolysin-like protein
MDDPVRVISTVRVASRRSASSRERSASRSCATCWAATRERRSTTVGELARPALVVPETKDVGALLREQREQRQHLAILVDEYGATAGIVSLEDVLEELVGAIEDEYDLPDPTMTWIDDHTVQGAGSMTIDDLNEATGAELLRRGPRRSPAWPSTRSAAARARATRSRWTGPSCA